MIQTQPIFQQRIYIHLETTNKSFVDMHFYLKRIGIRNNKFFLALYDSGLAGIDPRDPSLSLALKQRVLRECIINYYYFIREVVRIPQSGSGGMGARYELNRGNLALSFLTDLNFNIFLEMPRQTGKTVGTLVRYLWCFQFGTSNSEIMFVHKDHGGSKRNLKELKEFRDMLPSYLQMSAPIDMNGNRLKVQNTVVNLEHPRNGNKIVTFPSARSEEAADRLGRGATQPLQYYDEFAFMPYNYTAYEAAVPASSKASENAAKYGAPYGRIITTTPGDLTTDEGMYAYNIRNNASVWDERYYDYSPAMLRELKNANKKSTYFLVRYTYQQLGKSNEYFEDQCKQLEFNWAKIRREILLEWSKASTKCPFSQEDLETIKSLCHEPIRTMLFGRVGQYILNIYEDIQEMIEHPPIIGVDPAGAMYQDSSAIVIIDSRTTRVTADFNCNFIPTDELADLIFQIVVQFMPNAVVNIESNSIGSSVIGRLIKTRIKKNMYYEWKEKVIEESFNGIRINKGKKLVKVYGTANTAQVRDRMIELLFERVRYHKDKFISPIIQREMEQMERKKGDKIEHSDNSHDDTVFAYLHALRLWYDGVLLADNFGIMRGSIRTDDNTEIEEGIVEQEINHTVTIDPNIMVAEDESIYDDVNEYFKNDKTITNEQFLNRESAVENAIQNQMMDNNPLFREAYNKHYNVDVQHQTKSIAHVDLPMDVFIVEDEEDVFGQKINRYGGNLNEIFNNITDYY